MKSPNRAIFSLLAITALGVLLWQHFALKSHLAELERTLWTERLFGPLGRPPENHVNRPKIPPKQPIAWILGDDRAANWSPLPAAERFAWVNLAKEGQTALQCLATLREQLSQHGPPSLVLLQIGFTDVAATALLTKELHPTVVENTKDQVAQILASIRDYGTEDCQLIITTPIPPGKAATWKVEQDELLTSLSQKLKSLIGLSNQERKITLLDTFKALETQKSLKAVHQANS